MSSRRVPRRAVRDTFGTNYQSFDQRLGPTLDFDPTLSCLVFLTYGFLQALDQGPHYQSVHWAVFASAVINGPPNFFKSSTRCTYFNLACSIEASHEAHLLAETIKAFRHTVYVNSSSMKGHRSFCLRDAESTLDVLHLSYT